MRTKYWANFTDSSWANFENGEYGNPALDGSFNARGPMCEGAVAGILWDIFDSNPDDYSERGDWGLTRLPHKADGIGDALSDGSDNILEALLNRTYGLERPDNIHEFYQTWFQSPDLGHCPEIYNIFYEHADSMHPPPKGCNCCQIRGNVDNFDQALDISDLIWLVDFMFCGGPPPPCWEQGNINGDTASEIDVSELIYLVDYMFTQGPPPPPCL